MKAVVEVLCDTGYYQVVKTTYPDGVEVFYLLMSDLAIGARTIAFTINQENANTIIHSNGSFELVDKLADPLRTPYAYIDEFRIWPSYDKWIRSDKNQTK